MPRTKTVKPIEENVSEVEVPVVETPVEITEPADPGVAEKKAKTAKADRNSIKVTVIAERLNIRKRPDVNSPVLTVVDNGTQLEVRDFMPEREWTEIVTGGYAMTRFLRA